MQLSSFILILFSLFSSALSAQNSNVLHTDTETLAALKNIANIQVLKKNDLALLDQYMQAQVSFHQFNGNVLIAKSGKIIYQKAFGYKNYLTKEVLDNNSVFELASISKQFTAMGILLLKEKGKLSLSDSLRKFFPELPYNNITIQQLLTHTSGLPEYIDAMVGKWNPKKMAFNTDVIQFLATTNVPANFHPGQKWEYSNTGYQMLASIIEKLSKQSFKDYMQANVFKPLGMQHSGVYSTRRSSKMLLPNYALGFVYSDSLKKYLLPDSIPQFDFVYYLDGIQGDGSIKSTTGDLLKWDRALKNHTLLSEDAQKQMITPQSTMDSVHQKYYGYGIMLGKNELGNYLKHGGEWPGYRTMLVHSLQQDITIIVLSNNESKVGAVADALAFIVTDRQIVVPYAHVAAKTGTASLNTYVGKYKIPFVPIAAVIEIYQKGEQLFYRFENDETSHELKYESRNVLFSTNGRDIQFEFEFGDADKVSRCFYVASSRKWAIEKTN